MTPIRRHSFRSSLALLAASSFILSACATNTERRGPPLDRGNFQDQPRSSGTFIHPVGILFAGMDRNGDAKISRKEMKGAAQAEWDGFDRNPSAAYFAAWSLKNLGSTDAQPSFMSFDRDFNGVIREDEFLGQMDREFDRLDKNKDGILERAEMIVVFNAPQGQSRARGEEGDKSRSKRGGGGRPSR